ncbi:MAG: radical SAM protein [Candidatus Lokiarchaeota archaeon]|nr:radical SAM protein [Candidatus Lokiarchaeota archaeon]
MSRSLGLIRVSAGSASVLGLHHLKMLHAPTTIHLLQYAPGGCNANCGFCPQAKESVVDKKQLSRVSWPEFPWHDVRGRVIARHGDGAFSRVCLQTVVYPGFVDDMLQAVRELLSTRMVPLSVALVPVGRAVLEELKAAGVDRVGIALDAATPALFSRVKGEEGGGPYTWRGHWRALEDALAVFGKGRVSTHIIVGLGETSKEVIELMQRVHDAGITIGLFAFTAVPGTRLESVAPPSLKHYRQIQLARYLIVNGHSRADACTFEGGSGDVAGWGVPRGQVVGLIEATRGRMFETTGCPGCNRPYYNESPRGPVYNHPAPLDGVQVRSAIETLFP